MSYPKNSYEIIIADNGSTDGSEKIMKSYAKKYDHVKTIFNGDNLGFSAGNNRAIEQAKGTYVVVLNNDCVVGKNWLNALVEQPEKDKSIVAVNSKIILYPKFYKVTFELPHAVSHPKITVYNSALARFIKDDTLNVPVYRSKHVYYADIPVDPYQPQENVKVTITYKARPNSVQNADACVVTSEDGSKLKMTHSSKNDAVVCTFNLLPKRIHPTCYDKIQNTGIVVFSNGGGRDRGAMVRQQTQDYEIDVSQYDEPADVYAACGAASLYRTSVLKELGGFHEQFFMYYEDVELSERLRRAGYKISYEPKAEVRHMHALSSKEGSSFFLYHAEKGRLLHMIYHFPLRIVLHELYVFALDAIKRHIYRIVKRQPRDASYQYLRITGHICASLPKLLIERARLNTKLKHSQKDLMLRIFNGTWLLKK